MSDIAISVGILGNRYAIGETEARHAARQHRARLHLALLPEQPRFALNSRPPLKHLAATHQHWLPFAPDVTGFFHDLNIPPWSRRLRVMIYGTHVAPSVDARAYRDTS
jgi:hypothetical protein